MVHLLLYIPSDTTKEDEPMAETQNTNIVKVLRMSREMMMLADEGDHERKDRSCGVLYGTLRDMAYKLRRLAEEERALHLDEGVWDVDQG
jgi:hypothetical protein